MHGTLKLLNKTSQLEIAQNVRIADSFYARAKGLLGERGLPNGQTLWIKGTRFTACNSIHTWFMSFRIDVVFVDDNLKVKAVYENLGPWRMTWPVAGATSVFEFAAGSLRTDSDTCAITVGDQLHVGH